MTELDELCEQLLASEIIQKIGRIVRFGQVVVTLHEERPVEASATVRKRPKGDGDVKK